MTDGQLPDANDQDYPDVRDLMTVGWFVSVLVLVGATISTGDWLAPDWAFTATIPIASMETYTFLTKVLPIDQ